MSKRFCAALCGLGLLAACGNDDTRANKSVELNWNLGDSWHLAASYRLADAQGETGAVGLDVVDVAVGELWSDEVVWTYQVVEDNVTPGKNDAMHDFAATDSRSMS